VVSDFTPCRAGSTDHETGEAAILFEGEDATTARVNFVQMREIHIVNVAVKVDDPGRSSLRTH
jgi:hypothetical protein